MALLSIIIISFIKRMIYSIKIVCLREKELQYNVIVLLSKWVKSSLKIKIITDPNIRLIHQRI